MSQYKDQITGQVVCDARMIGRNLLNFSHLQYNSEARFDNPIVVKDGKFSSHSLQNKVESAGSGTYAYNYTRIYVNNINMPPKYTLSCWKKYNLNVSDLSYNYWSNATTLGFSQSDNNNTQRQGRMTTTTLNPDEGHQGFYHEIQVCNNTNGNWDITKYSFSPATPNFDVWEHFALVADGGKTYYYINGIKVLTNDNGPYLESVDIPNGFVVINCWMNCQSGVTDLQEMDDIVLIRDQALWTGDSFEVPNNYLTGEKEFNSQYVIWSDNTLNITGDVVLDARVTRDRKMRNYGSVSFTGNSLQPKKTTISNENTFISNTGHPAKTEIKNYDSSSIWSGILFTPKSTLYIPLGSTTEKFTISSWVKINPVIFEYDTCQVLAFTIDDKQSGNCSYLPAWYIGSRDPGPHIFYKGKEATLYNFTPTITTPNNQWFHFCFVKNGTNFYVFVNGQSIECQNLDYVDYYRVCPAMISDNYAINVKNMRIELLFRKIGSTLFYMDDIVLIKDQALWTSNFTPPDYYLTGPKALADGEVVLNPLYSASVFDY